MYYYLLKCYNRENLILSVTFLILPTVGDQLLEVLKYAFGTAKNELLDEDALVKSAEKQLGIDSQSVRVSSDTIQALGDVILY